MLRLSAGAQRLALRSLRVLRTLERGVGRSLMDGNLRESQANSCSISIYLIIKIKRGRAATSVGILKGGSRS